MGMNSDKMPEEETREERSDPVIDIWNDEGAKRFNEALDEGSAYVQAGGHLPDDLECYFEEEEREYLHPEPCDTDEETLSSGDMELIFENSYIM
jgi:hypothetical protein